MNEQMDDGGKERKKRNERGNEGSKDMMGDKKGKMDRPKYGLMDDGKMEESLSTAGCVSILCI